MVYDLCYSPFSTGMIERTNIMLLSILWRYAMNETTTLAHCLLYAIMTMNRSISETTKFSSFESIHGVLMRNAVDLKIKQNKNSYKGRTGAI